MRRTILLLASMALAILFFLAITGSTPTAVQTTPAKPNVVFIITDDMRKDDLAYMPKTRNLIGSRGMKFNNAYVPLASCCPSRASVLRGQYVHNHQVWHSVPNGPDSGWEGWNGQGHENDNLATRMLAGGYRTGLFGKYMNGYSSTGEPPPGWSDFFAKLLGSGYFNYSVNDNGITKSYGSAPTDYFTDVLSAESQQFIQQSVDQGKSFLLYVAPNAPHDNSPKEPPIPAPRHVNSFDGEPAPRLASYNEANVADKPPWISSLPTISSTAAADIQTRHENRVESLQAVDEMVKALVNKLSATGQLSNTYIVFTSDNGWHHGEHRIGKHKERPYEESSHMPLLIRGPGVAAGSTIDKLVTFPDFMPTFLELGGITIPSYVDGTSLVPLLNCTVTDLQGDWRNAILLEGHNPGSPERDYFAIRTAAGLKYIEYKSGFKEFYDLASDPYERNSNPSSASAALVERLQRLKTCSGADCRSAEGFPGTTPPRVESTLPTSNAPGVDPAADLTATFSEQMDPATLTKSTFKLFKANPGGSTSRVTNVTVSLSTDGLTATLNPFESSATLLSSNIEYKTVITTEATDLAGNPLDQDTTKTGLQQKQWFFTVSQ